MTKAVIFDLDGTIMNTIEDITSAINVTFKHFGYKTITVKDCIKAINRGARQLIKDALLPLVLPEEKFSEVFAFYVKTYSQNPCNLTHLYDGIEDVIIAFKNNGYKVGVVTNKHLSITQQLLKEKLPSVQFDGIIGIDEGIIPKPDPTATLKLLNQIGVEPKNAYLVGDGDTDVLTAINAKVNGIAVLWGYRNKQALQQVGANIFASNPNDLLKIIL